MQIVKNAVHSKIDVFVKFESAKINLQIRDQIKKKGFLLFGSQGLYVCSFIKKSGSEPCRALGDLTWHDPKENS